MLRINYITQTTKSTTKMTHQNKKTGKKTKIFKNRSKNQSSLSEKIWNKKRKERFGI